MIKEILSILAVITFAIVIVASPTPDGVQRAEGVEYLITPLGLPCEPGMADISFSQQPPHVPADGSGLVLGFYPCPPVAQQGILLHVRETDDADFAAWHVTVRHSNGTAVQTFPRRRDGDRWASIGLQIGRVKTPTLDGVTIHEIAVVKLKPVAPAAIITAGPSFFGPPKE